MADNMLKFDDVFLGILQNCGKIEPFLEAIFFFLSRRTDFFHLMHSKDDKLGFPPGVARKMVGKIFEKYESLTREKEKKITNLKEKKNSEIFNQEPSITTPPVINEVEVETTRNADVKELPATKENLTVNSEPKIKECSETENKRKQESSQKSSIPADDCFNGAQNERYSWSQSISDVDIKIPVPDDIKKSRDLTILIKPESIKVELKQQPSTGGGLTSQVLLEGSLSNRIICEESMWSLIPRDHIAINLEKAQQKWWTTVLDGEEEIDRSKIDTTQSVQEFDENTQADIRKVMYDQQQKMMGKPTSDEQKTHDLLKTAWDAEGSPFKGTPFDPSTVNLSGSGT